MALRTAEPSRAGAGGFLVERPSCPLSPASFLRDGLSLHSSATILHKSRLVELLQSSIMRMHLGLLVSQLAFLLASAQVVQSKHAGFLREVVLTERRTPPVPDALGRLHLEYLPNQS